jgi:hypothetical protein
VANSKRNSPPGPAVDSSGQSVVDPSENVKALNEAGLRHQKELLKLTTIWLRREMQAEARAMRREMKLTREAQAHADAQERSRLDSIRTVDVAAVQRAAEVAAEAVAALAAQVPITADTVRTSLASTIAPILSNIAELQRAQYELQGAKVGVSDTKDTAAELARALQPLIDAIQLLTEDRSRGQGRTERRVETRVNRSVNVGMLAGVAGTLFGALSLLAYLLK